MKGRWIFLLIDLLLLLSYPLIFLWQKIRRLTIFRR